MTDVGITPAAPLPEPGQIVGGTPLEPLQQAPQQPSAGQSEDWRAKYEAAQQELASHADQLKLIQMIESDPTATQLLLDHFKANTDKKELPKVSGPLKGEITVDKLAEAIQLIAGKVQLMDFRSQTPDFESYRGKMQEILQKYPSLTLEDAYRFAKAESGGNGKPSVPVAEGAVKAPPPGGGDLDVLQKQVNEAKDFEGAVRTALLGAARRAGVRA